MMKDPGLWVMLFIAVFGMEGLGVFMVWNSLRPHRRPGQLTDDGAYQIYRQAERVSNTAQLVMGLALVTIVVCAPITLLVHPPP